MNKKGTGVSSILWIIAILLLVVLVLQVIPRIPEICNLDVNKILGKTPVAPQGAVFVFYNNIRISYFDPAFQYLFGDTFWNNIKFISGYKGVCESILSFQYHFIIALLALFWIVLTRFLFQLIRQFFHWDTYWTRVGVATRNDALVYVGLLIIYPTLMQIALVNRVIEIITFYYFTNWFVYSLILAIYVGWLPQLIKAAIYFNEYRKAQKAVFAAKLGITKLQSIGNAK